MYRLFFLLFSLILSTTSFSQQEQWKWLGPDSLPHWNSKGPCPNGLGLVSALFADPLHPDFLMAGSNTGGLFKSTDGGNTWRNISDASMPMVTGISSIVRDPLDPSRFYIGTGSSSYNREYGLGVWYSDDKGESWNPSGLSFEPWKKDGLRASVKKVLIDPLDPKILLALVRSTSAASIYLSTDRGITWEEVLREEGGFFFDAERDPGNPEIIYVGGRNFWSSRDGGKTWRRDEMDSPGNEGISRIAVSVHPGHPGKLWVMYTTDGERGVVLARSNDYGRNWETLGTYSYGNLSVGSWKMEFSVSPVDTDVFYAGGVYMHRSTDGGKTFQRISENRFGHPRWMHVDVRSMLVFAGMEKDIIYSGHDGGVSISLNGGDSWKDISGVGLGITQFWGITYDHENDRVWGGTQDLGLLMYSEGHWYNQGIYGDVYDGLALSGMPDTAVVLVNSGSRGMRKTRDGGKSWKHVRQPYDVALNDRPVAASKANPEIIFVGYNEVHVSRDFGDQWSKTSDFQGVFGVSGGERLSAIAVAPSDGDIVYAAYSEPAWSNEARKRIFRSLDGGRKWQDMSAGLVGARWAGITDIAVNPEDAFEVWVSVDGFWMEENGTLHKVYRSQDGGETWQNVSTGLPNLPVNCLLYLNQQEKVLCGTDAGVYQIDAEGNEWTPFRDGMPAVIVSDLETNPENTIVYAASFGRGLYRADMPIVEKSKPKGKKGFFRFLRGKKDTEN